MISNWARNVVFGAVQIHRPTSVDELRGIVAAAGRIRALGTGHSFSPVADTTAELVSLADMPPTIDIHADSPSPSVTVAAGVRYGDLAVKLNAAGFALHNLGSLPHISVAGACATGTHGSGNTNGSLSTAVSALEMVTGDGSVVCVRRGDEGFSGCVVALGTLGVVTRVTLDIEPTYEVAQYVYEAVPAGALDLDLFAAGYSVSLFTDWAGPADPLGPGINQVWVKRRGAPKLEAWTAPSPWHGATLADRPMHPIARISPEPATEQLGVPGPWHTRLPHFRLDFTPSVGEELQTEYFVAREDGPAAVAAVNELRDRIAPLIAVTEIRTIAADDLWLSPAYRRDSLALHFTWIDDIDAVNAVLPEIEARLALFNARPHWGKVFTMQPAAVGPLYQKLEDFGRLRAKFDPSGKFGNEFVDQYAPAAG